MGEGQVVKKLGEHPSVAAGLEILKRLAERAPSEAEMPFQWLDSCRLCSDTGFVRTERGVNGAPCVFSKPCSCNAGVSRLEGIENDCRRIKRQQGATTEADRVPFARLFKRLCVQFGKETTGQKGVDLAEAYWSELQHYSEHELERGFKHAARNCKFFPRISDILDGINGAPI